MKQLKMKVLVAALGVSLLSGSILPFTAEAANSNSATLLASELSGARNNLTYLEGQPGDQRLVYTYEQNGEVYKVVEEANEDFSEVNSTFYLLSDQNEFEVNSSQHLEKKNNDITITFENSQSEIYDTKSIPIELSEDGAKISTQQTEWEWITQYKNGKKTGLKGLGVSSLISILASIATYYTSGIAAAVAVGLVSNAANRLFASGSSTTYYYAVYNWRHSPKNYLVIDEAQTTSFYLDAQHTYRIGNPVYVEYIY